MKITSKSKTNKNTNYKAFNVTFVETENGFKTLGVFGATDPSASEESWQRLNSRNFTRQLKNQKLITH